MRKIYLSLLVFFSFSFCAQAQVYLNTFTGASACPTSGNIPTVATNATGTPLTRNTVVCNATANVFNSTTLNNTSTISDASYIEFSVSANSGYQLNLSSLSFFRQGSGTAPNQLEVRYSTDGFATSTSWGAAPLTSTTGSVTTWDFADFTSPAGGTVTFRFYPYGTQRADLSAPAAATTGTFRLDDVTVNGTVTAVGASSNTITTGTVSTSPFCIDATTTASGTVAYTSTGGYLTTFTAYLSDAAGNFNSPISIGSGSAVGTDPFGTINITIPAGTPSGTGYRIRVSSPTVTGSSSAPFEIVNGAKNVTNVTATPSSSQVSVNWTNPTTCFNEVLIVAKAGASITTTPTGDGSAYTASSVYGTGTGFNGGFVVFKGTTSPVTITGLTNGTTYYIRIFSRRGTNWSSGVEITVTPNVQPNVGEIVINQFSPQYSAVGADEYIELVNKTNNTYDLSGLAIRYQAANGNSGSAGGTLSGTLLGKRFWLLSPNSTITVGVTNGLARDGAITSGLSATGGQIALVRLSDNTVIDAVGYGTLSGGTYSEANAAPVPTANGGLKRITDGVDTDNNLNDFAVVDNANIFLRNSASPLLPVKFTSVRAAQKGTGIEISWSNATEENVNNYTIERSMDGRNFSQLSQVTARSNNGNRVDYNFVDATPLSSDNFYRIKAAETTGKEVYSNVVRINLGKKGTDLAVYPNPVKGSELMVQMSNLPAGKYLLKVYSVSGQEVDSRLINHTGGNVSETLTLRNLKQGLYILQISGNVNLQKTFVAE